MPWKVLPVHEVRFALVHAVRHLNIPVAAAARQFGVSRRVAYKWLARHDADPGATLRDRSRRPASSPTRTPDDVEQRVLRVRDRFNWGPRKIHFYLLRQEPDLPAELVPAIRTVADILRRHDRILLKTFRPRRPRGPTHALNAQPPTPSGSSTSRDPSRSIDASSCRCRSSTTTPATAWPITPAPTSPWTAPGTSCGRSSATSACPSRSWPTTPSTPWAPRVPPASAPSTPSSCASASRPATAAPYHPQTQGKVERLNGTSVRELIDFNARRDCCAHFVSDCRTWRGVYNTLRPHEALGDLPPVTRWRPSPRPRPPALPEVTYHPGAVLRIVGSAGVITFNGYRLLCGRGIAGQPVQIKEQDHELIVCYATRVIRNLSTRNLRRDTVL